MKMHLSTNSSGLVTLAYDADHRRYLRTFKVGPTGVVLERNGLSWQIVHEKLNRTAGVPLRVAPAGLAETIRAEYRKMNNA